MTPHLFYGRRMAGMRKALGLSQSQLAEAIDVPPAFISHLETGKRLPSVPTLRRLAIALRCSADFLLGIEGRP